MKAGQAAVFFWNGLLGTGYINLHHLAAAVTAAGVLHPHLHTNLRTVTPQMKMLDSDDLNGKIRVGFSVSESIAHRDIKGIKVAVAHVDAFLILLGLHIPVIVGKCAGIGVVLIAQSPGIRQFSAGRHLAEEDVGHRISALHAGLYDLQHGLDVGTLIQDGKLHQTSGVDEQDDVAVEGADFFQDAGFLLGEQVISLPAVAVGAFTGHTAPYIDGGVGIGFVRHGTGRHGIRGLTVCEEQLHTVVHRHGLTLVPYLFFPGFPGGLILSVEGFYPVLCGDFHAGKLQALQNGDRGPLIDIAGAGSPFDGFGGSGAV